MPRHANNLVRALAVRQTSPITELPAWVAPQLSKPAETVPEGRHGYPP
jgi:hypothetical protein